MLLAIDIGNTQIATGVFVGDELVVHWRLSSAIDRTEDETWILMKYICSEHGYDISAVKGVSISSVVPNVTATFEKVAVKYLGLEPVVVSSKIKTGLKIMYDNPANVGADRICNAVAGYEKFGGPLVIVDLGTATTFDVITKNGEYLGGIIAPGIEMSAMILHQRAAKLPRVELHFPESVIGQSTETSMQSGLMYGTVEMVKGFINRINQEMGQEVKVVLTGGLARLIINKLGSGYTLEPFLTLEGLKKIFEKVK
ncbi:MAG TPA: type III pantothenate kinase [bacterium]|nr:type III pantothenate kinase [bacterium]HPN43129.1 type III pantothenate kinase [bacterium]